MEAKQKRAEVRVVDHPLIGARLSILRAKTTSYDEFRHNLQEISVLLLVEASRGWATTSIEIETPLKSCAGVMMAKPIVLVPILRAGLGMLDGMLRMVPDSAVGHIGLWRDPATLRPRPYYSRLPETVAQAEVLLIDPMLATGHSACEAVSFLKKNGAQRIQFVCVIACPAGVEQLQTQHPDVPIFTSAIDSELNASAYIVPGLGDAGDRYFGTD